MTRALLSVAILALAACSPAAPEGSDPQAETWTEAPATLGGVDLGQPIRALGTEPFWGVDVDGATLVYSGVDRAEQTARTDGPEIMGTTAVWRGRTDRDQAMEVTLIATECSDGMSDRIYPLTAVVTLGDETLNGCAAATDWIMTTPEAG